MTILSYRFAESAIRITGKAVEIGERVDGEWIQVPKGLRDVDVEMYTRADRGDARTLELSGKDYQIGATLTADTTLRSISFNSAGTGGAWVSTGVSLAATVGTIAAKAVGIARAGLTASTLRADDQLKAMGQEGDGEPDKQGAAQRGRLRTPGELRKAWLAEGSEEATAIGKYQELRAEAIEALRSARSDLNRAATPTETRQASRRTQLLGRNLDEINAEIEKLAAGYTRWLAHQRHELVTDFTTEIDIGQVYRRDPEHADGWDSALDPMLENYSVAVEFVDERRGEFAYMSHTPPELGHQEHTRVRWRVPRPVTLRVWMKGPNGEPQLVRTAPCAIADEKCDTAAVDIDSGWFGKRGGTLEFDDSGALSSIQLDGDSGATTIAEALAGLPDTVKSAIEQGQAVQQAVSAVASSGHDAAVVEAERRVASLAAHLEGRGEFATDRDRERLRRAEDELLELRLR